MLEYRIQDKLSVPCQFYKLNWNEHQKHKSIYAFILIYYSNIDAFNENKNIECKYMHYIGKCLKESRLIPYLGYCEHCCNKHGDADVSAI
ncbi:PIR Superfamily Protein [Plasmodium ovale wallikeri]|uniref:PIR Superfamily Protein n=1 Tax=Plasmodium ovale wallikeri TaxID=864142 RepID=A0A1A9APW0_PLAOA|nr:PIR Superfamily Protein [Plasmodium ovale wallikeri]